MTDLTKLSVVALRQELKKVGLSTGGKKEELIRRLQDHLDSESLGEAVEVEPSSAAPEAATQVAPNKLNVPATLVKLGAGTPTNTPVNITAPVSNLSKSVPHNGNGVAPDAVSAPLSAKAETIAVVDGIAVSGLSAEERLKIRQQRFNTTINVGVACSNQSSDKAAERRAKFGLDPKSDEKVSQRREKVGTSAKESTGYTANAEKKPAITTKVDPEVLRKRQEKFGGLSETASKKLSDIELEEKKRKRLEKFNLADSVDKRTKTEA